jgi:hypothetical protein
MNFTRFIQKLPKSKESICKQTLGKIRKFTYIPLVCTKALGKNPDQAMWSLGWTSGTIGRNPVTSPAFLAGGAAGEELGLHGLCLRVQLRQKGNWRAQATESGGGRRGSGCSGEAVARPRQ